MAICIQIGRMNCILMSKTPNPQYRDAGMGNACTWTDSVYLIMTMNTFYGTTQNRIKCMNSKMTLRLVLDIVSDITISVLPWGILFIQCCCWRANECGVSATVCVRNLFIPIICSKINKLLFRCKNESNVHKNFHGITFFFCHRSFLFFIVFGLRSSVSFVWQTKPANLFYWFSS